MRSKTFLFLLTVLFYPPDPAFSVAPSTSGEKEPLQGEAFPQKKEHVWREALWVSLALKKPTRIIPFNDDSESVVSVIAYSGAFEGTEADGNHQMVVSSEEILASGAQSVIPATSVAQGRGSSLRAFLQTCRPTHLRTAFIREAQALSISAEPPDTESPSICDEAGITCCPIQSDGSAECHHGLTDRSLLSLQISVVNADGVYSDGVPRNIQPDMMWVAGDPKSMAHAGDNLFTVTDSNRIIRMSPQEGETRVIGNFAENYLDTALTNGRQIAFDGRNYLYPVDDEVVTVNLIGVLNPTEGIQLYVYNPATEQIVTPPVPHPVDHPVFMQQFTAFKLTHGMEDMVRGGNKHLMYGIQTPLQSMASVYYATDEFPFFDPEPDPRRQNRIQFLDPTTSGGIQHTKTIAFDVDLDRYALVVFEDGGNKYIGMGNSTSIAAPLAAPADFGSDIRDLVIYRQNAESSGKAFILDKTNSKLWIAEYDHRDEPVIFPIMQSVDLGTGKNPEAIVLSETVNTAYLVNSGDDTLTVLQIYDEEGSEVLIPRHISLSSLFSDVDVPFVPTSISLKDGTLSIGCAGLKAIVKVNTESL